MPHSEWVVTKDGEKVYTVSHAKAVVRGKRTVDNDLTDIENSIVNLQNSQNATETNSVKLTGSQIINGDKRFNHNVGINTSTDGGTTSGYTLTIDSGTTRTLSGYYAKGTLKSALIQSQDANSVAGGYIQLETPDSGRSPGSFWVGTNLNTGDQKYQSVLVGTPQGSLTWKGQNLVRVVNGKQADAEGRVDIDTVPTNRIAMASEKAVEECYQASAYNYVSGETPDTKTCTTYAFRSSSPDWKFLGGLGNVVETNGDSKVHVAIAQPGEETNQRSLGIVATPTGVFYTYTLPVVEEGGDNQISSVAYVKETTNTAANNARDTAYNSAISRVVERDFNFTNGITVQGYLITVG